MSRTLLVLMVFTLLIGCGDSSPPVYKVTGTVTFNDAPLPTGTVLFVPKAGGPTAQGEIGPDGKYTLTTFRSGDGAVPGMHSVMVTAMKDNGPTAGHTPLVPEKFSSEQSGLTGEVQEKDVNVVDLKLTGKMQNLKPPVEMP